jgi:hypothetical protein
MPMNTARRARPNLAITHGPIFPSKNHLTDPAISISAAKETVRQHAPALIESQAEEIRPTRVVNSKTGL